MEALDRLKKGIDLCWDKHDTGTRELLEHILQEEEEGVDWLETQLSLVATVGKVDAKKRIEDSVMQLMSTNIVQLLGTMLDTVVF